MNQPSPHAVLRVNTTPASAHTTRPLGSIDAIQVPAAAHYTNTTGNHIQTRLKDLWVTPHHLQAHESTLIPHRAHGQLATCIRPHYRSLGPIDAIQVPTVAHNIITTENHLYASLSDLWVTQYHLQGHESTLIPHHAQGQLATCFRPHYRSLGPIDAMEVPKVAHRANATADHLQSCQTYLWVGR